MAKVKDVEAWLAEQPVDVWGGWLIKDPFVRRKAAEWFVGHQKWVVKQRKSFKKWKNRQA